MLPKEDESIMEIPEITTLVDAMTAATQLSTDGMTGPFAYRICKVTACSILVRAQFSRGREAIFHT